MDSGTLETSRGPAPHGHAEQRAVIWLPADRAAPAALLESLRKRGIPVTLATSSLLTMAHACHAHMQPGVKVGVLVILCEAARLPAVADACLAIRRFATRARCWIYDPAGPQSLRQVEDQDIVNWGAVAVPCVDDAPAAGPKTHATLKLASPAIHQATNGHSTNGHANRHAQAAHDDAEDTLSAEELRMLLGRDAPR